jgi:amidase
MRTVVVVDLIKGGGPSWPRVESDDYLMSTGSARPLEDAYRVSQHDLVTWAGELTGWDTLDAYQLVSQAGMAPAGNVVDTNYTMVAKLAKKHLGSGAVVADGVHDRLRQTAEACLAQR